MIAEIPNADWRYPDALYPTWTGDVCSVPHLWSDAVGWIEPASLPKLSVDRSGIVAIVALRGVMARRCWRMLADVLEAIHPGVSGFDGGVLLVIDSEVQQLSGYARASRALRMLSRALPVCAYVENAGGLALSLAAWCEYVFASPVARFGHLTWGRPLKGCVPGTREQWGRSRHKVWELSVGAMRRFSDYGLCRRMQYHDVHGEQLEGRGVDHLAPNWQAAARFMNSIMGGPVQ